MLPSAARRPPGLLAACSLGAADEPARHLRHGRGGQRLLQRKQGLYEVLQQASRSAHRRSILRPVDTPAPACSDLWMGDSPASNSTFGYAFRGRRIVAAVIQSLMADKGMVAGHRMLFGGCSAGAIGAMINLDSVAAIAGQAGVEVRRSTRCAHTRSLTAPLYR